MTLPSPAKINLMLSVHGQRGDGFHELTSLVAALDFGDTLHVGLNDLGQDRLTCSDAEVPVDEGNLIMQAATAFRETAGISQCFDFDLEKRIPMGAGLGGGSSNAATALKAMNQLTQSPLDREQLIEVAAVLGSDCPLFMDAVPSVMSGRGEILEPLEPILAERVQGQRIVLFKPGFSVNTAWAYRRLIDSIPTAYTSVQHAKRLLDAFFSGGPLSDLLHNTFENPVGRKYLAIPCLLDDLRQDGHSCLMSGSGSCCFALVADSNEAMAIREKCLNAWGEGTFFIESTVV